MKMKKGVFTGLYGAMVVLCGVALGYGAQEEIQGKASVSFPEPDHTFNAVFEGASIPHDFVIRNKGTGVLDVNRVDGG